MLLVILIIVIIVILYYFNKGKIYEPFTADKSEDFTEQDFSIEKNKLKDTSLYLNFLERTYYEIDKNCQQVANKHLSKDDKDIFDCSIHKQSLNLSKDSGYEDESGASCYEIIFEMKLFDLGYKELTDNQVRALTELLYEDLGCELRQKYPKIDISYGFGTSIGICGFIKVDLRECYKELKDIY